MQPVMEVTGMVLKCLPVGEYDKTVTILTLERGKISVYARNSRKMNSKLLAAMTPMCFGTFHLYAGRSSYTLSEAHITHYFEKLRADLDATFYGMYFLEVADYYTRENNDETLMLKLLFQSMRALTHEKLSRELVRAVFECKAMVVNGEFPGIPAGIFFSEAAKYAIDYIQFTPVEKLYQFTLEESVLSEVQRIVRDGTRRVWDHHFQSLDLIEDIKIR